MDKRLSWLTKMLVVVVILVAANSAGISVTLIIRPVDIIENEMVIHSFVYLYIIMTAAAIITIGLIICVSILALIMRERKSF